MPEGAGKEGERITENKTEFDQGRIDRAVSEVITRRGDRNTRAVCDGDTARAVKGSFSKDGLRRKQQFLELLELLEKDKPKLSTFSPEWLPPAVSRFSEYLKEILQVSREMTAPATIAACSLGIQKKYCAHPLPDWYEPANLYMAVIAEASERKSPAMKEIVEPIYEYEWEENQRIAPEIAAYEAKKKILEKNIDNIIKGMASNRKKNTDSKYLDMGDLDTYQRDLAELEEVAPVRLVVDDVTVEVLGQLMEQNQERMGIMSTEGGIFNILAGRYNDKVLIDIILKGYSGDHLVQDRVNRPGLELRHPLITMLLYVQPVVIEEIMDNSEFVRRGLNARFLYVIPPSTIGERSYRVQKMPENVKKDYSDVIRRLFAIPVPDKPKPVALSKEADELAEKFFYEVEGIMKDASPELKAWYGKLHGTTIRIALTLHCMQYIEQSEFHEISGETMQNAIEMASFFQSHAEAAFNIMGLADPPEVRDAKRILKIIDSMEKVEFPLSELLQKCKPKKGLEKREDVIPGLNCLTNHGYIRIWQVHPSSNSSNSNNSNKRGRPTEIVYVNPEYIKRKEERERHAK